MRRVFGARKKKEPAPSLEDTTSSLNSRGENIDEKIRKLEGELSRFRDQLKRVKGPAQAAIKQRALRVLKQKRMYEQQRDQLYNQSFNLEQVAFATQNIKDTQATVASMKSAAKEIKKEYKKVDINEIENLNDEMADMLDLTNEIQETLGQTFGVPDDIDEEELMGELDALEDEMLNEEVEEGAAPSYLTEEVEADALSLPSAPDGAPAVSDDPLAAPANREEA